MLCQKVFSARWRRHHCRYCGWAVCSTCMAPNCIEVDHWVTSTEGHGVRWGDRTKCKKVCTECAIAIPSHMNRFRTRRLVRCRKRYHRLSGETNTVCDMCASAIPQSVKNISCRCGLFQLPDVTEDTLTRVNGILEYLFRQDGDITVDSPPQVIQDRYNTERTILSHIQMGNHSTEPGSFDIRPLRNHSTQHFMDTGGKEALMNIMGGYGVPPDVMDPNYQIPITWRTYKYQLRPLLLSDHATNPPISTIIDSINENLFPDIVQLVRETPEILRDTYNTCVVQMAGKMDEVSPVKAPTPAPQDAPKPLKVVGKAGEGAGEEMTEEAPPPSSKVGDPKTQLSDRQLDDIDLKDMFNKALREAVRISKGLQEVRQEGLQEGPRKPSMFDLEKYWDGKPKNRSDWSVGGVPMGWTNCPKSMDIVDIWSTTRRRWLPARVMRVYISETGDEWEIDATYLEKAHDERLGGQNFLQKFNVLPTSVAVHGTGGREVPRVITGEPVVDPGPEPEPQPQPQPQKTPCECHFCTGTQVITPAEEKARRRDVQSIKIMDQQFPHSK